MSNYITLKGSVTKIGELSTGKSGDGKEWKRLALNLAQNESVSKKVDGKTVWEELPAKYWSLTIWGRDAEMLSNMDLPLGTKMLVTGRLKLRLKEAYTSPKTGETYPEQLIDDIDVEEIAILVTGQYGRTISVESSKGNKSSQSSKSEKVEKEKEQPKSTKEPTKPAPKSNDEDDDLFGGSDDEDIFGTSSTSDDDDFDIFG